LALAFQGMLDRYELSNKVLAVVGDNATSNDTQMAALGLNPNNTYTDVNRVRCLNHTINLAV
ncbi:hypothetical protein C8R46DRAFT_831542, partial [Mycena filopes]